MEKKLTNEEYHAYPNSLSSSDLKNLDTSINVWQAKRKESKAMNLGSIFHDFVLEGIDRSLVLPKVNKASKTGMIELLNFENEWYAKNGFMQTIYFEDSKMDELKSLHQAFVDLVKDDYLLIDQAEKDGLEAMKSSFYSHPEAKYFFYMNGDFVVEESLFISAKELFGYSFEGDDGSFLIKVRLDYGQEDEDNGYIGDLKSAMASDPWGFKRAVYKYKYHASAALYLNVSRALGKKYQRFLWGVTENASPFNTELYWASDEILSQGWEIIESGWRRFIEYKNQGEAAYRGYSVNGEVREL